MLYTCHSSPWQEQNNVLEINKRETQKKDVKKDINVLLYLAHAQIYTFIFAAGMDRAGWAQAQAQACLCEQPMSMPLCSNRLNTERWSKIYTI